MGILDLFNPQKKTLLLSGCSLPKALQEKEEDNYANIFNLLGIKYNLPEKEGIHCGLTLYEAGYKKDAKKIAEKNKKYLSKKGFKKIITSCPSCYYMYYKIYPTLLLDWDIEVEHAVQTIHSALKKRNIKAFLSESEKEIVSYQDSCYLGRLGGIYDEPREIITLLGSKILEPKKNKGEAPCCGSSGNLHELYPKTASLLSTQAIKNYPARSRIITSCFLCHQNLAKSNDTVIEFSSHVLGKLRGLLHD